MVSKEVKPTVLSYSLSVPFDTVRTDMLSDQTNLWVDVTMKECKNIVRSEWNVHSKEIGSRYIPVDIKLDHFVTAQRHVEFDLSNIIFTSRIYDKAEIQHYDDNKYVILHTMTAPQAPMGSKYIMKYTLTVERQDEHTTRLEYAIDVEFTSGIPQFLQRMLRHHISDNMGGNIKSSMASMSEYYQVHGYAQT